MTLSSLELWEGKKDPLSVWAATAFPTFSEQKIVNNVFLIVCLFVCLWLLFWWGLFWFVLFWCFFGVWGLFLLLLVF